MEFRKRLWLLYVLVSGLEIVLTMFVANVQHQSAKNASNWSRTAVCFRSFIQTSSCGVNWLLWALADKWKNCTNFLLKFFITYLGCVIIKTNQRKKISTCYVKYAMFILEKTKQKGSIDSFGPSRVKLQNSLASFPDPHAPICFHKRVSPTHIFGLQQPWAL